MNPRRKKDAGLDFWVTQLVTGGFIGRWEADRFLRENGKKEQRLAQRGLPQLSHYGYFTSTREIRARLRDVPNQRFIVRATHRGTGAIDRLLDTNLRGACRFAGKLAGGMELWEVEVKEFVETRAAGTIVISPSGSMKIETWWGPHYLVVLNPPTLTAHYNDFSYATEAASFGRISWEVQLGLGDVRDLQRYALRALRYHTRCRYPKPAAMLEPVYLEYGVRADGSVYFIDASDSPIMTGRM